jgi:tyrosyl-tRNA synthetase
MPSVDEQLELVLRNVDVVRPEADLREKLASGRPLRVKLGLDPTAPAVTLGWAVVLRKLRHFQELGHTAVLIVGDFTAQVGDPSGKSETRRRLSNEEVQGYARAVLTQFQKVLLPEPLEIRYNSEWLGSLDMAGVLELTAKTTVAHMLERGDFAKRLETGSPISIMEFMYPLLQGYDSVAVAADIELGGSDQLWNLMMGRIIQEKYGHPPQVAMTMPLLLGVDGTQKMSQSLGNYIGVGDSPDQMFGRTMSVPDSLIEQWLRLASELPGPEVDRLVTGLGDGSAHPGEVKRLLARSITDLYHGAGAGARAESDFDRMFKDHLAPAEIAEYRLPPEESVSLPSLLRESGLVASAGEGRRLIEQGAVRIDGSPVGVVEIARAELVGRVLQVGKRKFRRLV